MVRFGSEREVLVGYYALAAEGFSLRTYERAMQTLCAGTAVEYSVSDFGG